MTANQVMRVERAKHCVLCLAPHNSNVMANKMRLTLLVVILLLSAVASADQTQEWLRMLENPKYPSQRLKPGNELHKYSNYGLCMAN